MKSRVAAIQMVTGADVELNLEAAAELIHEAADDGATLVVLPENFAVLDGGPLSDFAEVDGDENSLLQGFLSWQSKKHQIVLVGGSIPLCTRPCPAPQSQGETVAAGLVRPACLVYGSEGERLARYDKLHLFDVRVADRQAEYSESRSYEAGSEVIALTTPAGCLGLSICYDLRFPELYRRLCDEGAELLSIPSAFTHVTGEAHWEVLIRARAVENQCYAIAANQGGTHNESRETWGHSMIVDPWGKILAQAEKGPAVVSADIDLEYLKQVRENMPLPAHRRL